MVAKRLSIAIRILMVVVVVVIAAALLSGAAMASETVNISVSPIDGGRQLYIDANGDHQQQPSEYVGTFPVYGSRILIFSWRPYPFAPGVHGSYKVAMLQDMTPLNKQPTWAEFMTAHDWADNPAGTKYVMGPFLADYGICSNCPTKIVVTAETYQAVQDPQTGDWSYVYTPIVGAAPVGTVTATPTLTPTSTPTLMPVGTPTPTPTIIPYAARGTAIQESWLFLINVTHRPWRCPLVTTPDC